MLTCEDVIGETGISNTVARRWAEANQKALSSAKKKIESMNANPWVFMADKRHFYQFATEVDKAAKAALTTEEFDALLGPDWDDDWDKD